MSRFYCIAWFETKEEAQSFIALYPYGSRARMEILRSRGDGFEIRLATDDPVALAQTEAYTEGWRHGHRYGR